MHMLGPQQSHLRNDLKKFENYDPNPDHLIPGISNSKVAKARGFYKHYKPTANEVNADLRKYYDPDPRGKRDNLVKTIVDNKLIPRKHNNTYRSNISLGQPLTRVQKNQQYFSQYDRWKTMNRTQGRRYSLVPTRDEKRYQYSMADLTDRYTIAENPLFTKSATQKRKHPLANRRRKPFTHLTPSGGHRALPAQAEGRAKLQAEADLAREGQAAPDVARGVPEPQQAPLDAEYRFD
jgi:hypothetical protein